MVTDVFTREAATKTLSDKRAETMRGGLRRSFPSWCRRIELRTDLGNEFQGLEALSGRGAPPDSSDCNATAVVDRAIPHSKCV